MLRLRLVTKTNQFTWQPEVSTFLSSYIYRFAFPYGVFVISEISLVLNPEMCDALILRLDEALEDCIVDLFTEPDMKMLGKYPTRFEKVFLKGKKYTVNYTTSLAGRMIYSVWNVRNFLKEEMEQNEFVTILLYDT